MLIKICGLKRKVDIEYANKHFPDFIGFVFAESKRRVSLDEAMVLSKNLLPSIKKAGVFVNESIDSLKNYIEKIELDVIQLSGDEDFEYVEKVKCIVKDLTKKLNKKIKIWKTIRVKNEESLSDIGLYNVDAILLDTFIEGSYGGSGKVFDWELANKAKDYGNIIIAGGLNPNNVLDAINKGRPFAVDVSSGVETDSFKDEEKIKQFIYSARISQY